MDLVFPLEEEMAFQEEKSILLDSNVIPLTTSTPSEISQL